jgi:adenosylcobinamide kinase / adenosylcobinamide-phosphate guanylyltransferase
MKQMTLILGGARSGKSTYAQECAQVAGGTDVLYIATATTGDEEMKARIANHRSERPIGWRTLEASRQVGRLYLEAGDPAAVVIVDCVTLLVSNCLMSWAESTPGAWEAVGFSGDQSSEFEGLVASELSALLAAYSDSSSEWLVVSNEVGLGLVPPNALGRLYRDALGRANQRLAAVADHVVLLIAGLPMRIK